MREQRRAAREARAEAPDLTRAGPPDELPSVAGLGHQRGRVAQGRFHGVGRCRGHCGPRPGPEQAACSGNSPGRAALSGGRNRIRTGVRTGVAARRPSRRTARTSTPPPGCGGAGGSAIAAQSTAKGPPPARGGRFAALCVTPGGRDRIRTGVTRVAVEPLNHSGTRPCVPRRGSTVGPGVPAAQECGAGCNATAIRRSRSASRSYDQRRTGGPSRDRVQTKPCPLLLGS